MALRDKVTPRERLYIEAHGRAPRAGPEGRGRCRLHRRPPQARRRVSGRSRSEIDARPRARQRLRSGHQGTARAHDGSDRAARGSRQERRRRVWRASLPDSRLGRQQDAGEGVARQRALRGSRHRTSRTPRTCRDTSTRRATSIDAAISSFSAAAAIEQKWIAVGLALPDRPSRPQRALPDAGAESRRPLRRLDEVGAAPADVQGEPARATATTRPGRGARATSR